MNYTQLAKNLTAHGYGDSVAEIERILRKLEPAEVKALMYVCYRAAEKSDRSVAFWDSVPESDEDDDYIY